MSRQKKESGFWGFVQDFQGDKVIWMIVLVLIMVSILAISSSTPLLAIQSKSTRTAIINEQFLISGLGLGIIAFCYSVIRKIGFLRVISQLGYGVSMFLLLCLAIRVKTPFFRASEINGAVRALTIFGFQLHVFEFVKIFMVMYLSWAIHVYHERWNDDGSSRNREKGFTLAELLSETKSFAWMGERKWQLFLYIFFPILCVSVLILLGSVSSTLFIGAIMLVTILIGGIRIRDMLIYGVVGIGLVAGCIGLYFVSGGKIFQRFGTAVGRITLASEDPEEELKKLPKGTAEFQEKLDQIRQPISAKVAVSEGGIFGKGPGRSTQRYVVPVMFEDYMFSFIVEEYGILGAILVLILYGGLLARGWILVRNSENMFAKTAISGLVLLISGQAVMHMLINVDLFPLTGQTLPMISHGNSSFLAFSLAFGIILSISRMVKAKMDKIAAEVKPIVEKTDEIRESLNDLDQID